MKDKTVNQIVDELEGLLEATGMSAVELMEGVLEAPVPSEMQAHHQWVPWPLQLFVSVLGSI